MNDSLNWSDPLLFWLAVSFGLISAMGLGWGGWLVVRGKARWPWKYECVGKLPIPYFWTMGYVALIFFSMVLHPLLPPVTALCGAIFLMRRHGVEWVFFWRLRDFFQHRIVAQALMIVAVLLVPLYSFHQGLIWLWEWRGWEAGVQPAVNELQQAGGLGEKISVLLLAALAAPIAEEITFRGFLYPIFKHHLSRGVAVGLQALLFGMMHGHMPTFFPLALLGLILVWCYEFSGTLALPILMHAVFNVASCLMLMFVLPS